MNKVEKQGVIDGLTEKFGASSYFYFADASGLTVEVVNKLRRSCFEKGIGLQVAKNTLIKKALVAAGKNSEELDTVLAGPTAILFAENGNAPAKLIKEFRKAAAVTKPALKGAYIDSSIYLGEASLEDLVNLKSKDQLIGEIIGMLQSPAQNVISALQSSGNKLAGILKTLSEKESN